MAKYVNAVCREIRRGYFLNHQENNHAASRVRRAATSHHSAPVSSASAPTMTCSVVTSAALFDQMVAAPKTICSDQQDQPEKGEFRQPVAAAEFFPRQHRRRRDAEENRIGDKAVDHLQIHLKRRDGIADGAGRARARCNARWLPALVAGQIFPYASGKSEMARPAC